MERAVAAHHYKNMMVLWARLSPFENFDTTDILIQFDLGITMYLH